MRDHHVLMMDHHQKYFANGGATGVLGSFTHP
jgi:hypothetical protein